MKSLLNRAVTFDLFMSWNAAYWGSQMGAEAIEGSASDYMASQIAMRIEQLQGALQRYNSALENYKNAASSLNLAFKNATHFDIGGGVILERLGGGNRMAGAIVGGLHKNNSAAEGTFALYEIMVEGQTLKYGLADAGRIRKTGEFAGLPERLAQQLSRINKYAPELNVTHRIRTVLQTGKAEMIELESATILAHAKQLGVPMGNLAHIKKWAEAFGKDQLGAKALQALSKFMKL